MYEDYDNLFCPNCDEELTYENYCDNCDKQWTETELDEHQEKENAAYIKWCEKQHPGWYGW